MAHVVLYVSKGAKQGRTTMAKASTLAVGALVLAACGDASPPGNVHSWISNSTELPPLNGGYGWDDPITTENFGATAAKKLGQADAPLAGFTLRQIVTDASVRVRSDNKACASCHEWAASETSTSFCARVNAFVALPTSTNEPTDPANAKPSVLKELFSAWVAADCP